jgi:hypothetical protein
MEKVSTHMSNIIKDDDGFRRFMALAAEQEGQLLKFVKGRYYSGETEVPLGTEMIAAVDRLARGLVKFVGGKVIDRRVGLVATGFEPPPRCSSG